MAAHEVRVVSVSGTPGFAGTWNTESAIICTDEAFVTIQVTTTDGDTYGPDPRQLPGYTETSIHVGIGNTLSVDGTGTFTITESGSK
jgi:DNA/RNA endonuclease YhcR with UshA esterase domain